MINEHERIVLTKSVPNEGLEAGDVGTVVHVYADGLERLTEFSRACLTESPLMRPRPPAGTTPRCAIGPAGRHDAGTSELIQPRIAKGVDVPHRTMWLVCMGPSPYPQYPLRRRISEQLGVPRTSIRGAPRACAAFRVTSATSSRQGVHERWPCDNSERHGSPGAQTPLQRGRIPPDGGGARIQPGDSLEIPLVLRGQAVGVDDVLA